MTLHQSEPCAGAGRGVRGGLSRAAVAAGVGVLLSLAGGSAAGGPEAEPIAAITAPRDLDPAKVRLGARLFVDARLSGSGSLACASCHDLAAGGDDGLPRSRGRDGRALDFNTPTVFNAALSFRLNWRGRFRDVEAQNEAVLLDPRIMGASWPALLQRLEGDADYAAGFEAAYGRPVRREDVLDALASFQRSLVTPGARFDRYLGGDRAALRPDELRGYALFKSYGCISCHHGRGVGGNLFQRFGIFGGGPVPVDDRVYRVPSLRNVAATAPYLHDGRAAKLERAIAVMGHSQLGVALPPEDVALIARFLRTLTGEYAGRPVASEP